jgi:hypothetical protein
MDGVVLDNDQTNPALPAGTLRVTVPAFSATMAFGPAAYPGTTAPMPGTSVVIGFIAPTPNTNSQTQIRILSLPGTGAAEVTLAELVANAGGPQVSGGTLDGVIAGLVTLGIFSS